MSRQLLLLAAACASTEPRGAWDEVAPILAERCATCHITGGIGPMPLDDATSAAPWAAAIVAATANRTMPPWGADGSGVCQTWKHAQWLSDHELTTLSAWAEAGAPGGDISAAPPAPERLDRVDALLDPGADYLPDAALDDDYRCFLVEHGQPADSFLTAFELEPGAPALVHHMILYSVDNPAAEARVRALDEQAPGLGYPCFGGSGVGDARMLAAWAPGVGLTRLPEGVGIRMVGAHPLVMQVHYNLAAGAEPDRSTVAIQLESSVPDEAFVLPLAQLALRLDPGQAAVASTGELDLARLGFPLGAYVRGVFPHMHELGISLRVEALGTGNPTCLVDVPRWDFHWQRLYLHSAPVYVAPDARLRITCTYDTRERTEVVTWGEGTGDEMCLAGLFVTFR